MREAGSGEYRQRPGRAGGLVGLRRKAGGVGRAGT